MCFQINEYSFALSHLEDFLLKLNWGISNLRCRHDWKLSVVFKSFRLARSFRKPLYVVSFYFCFCRFNYPPGNDVKRSKAGLIHIFRFHVVYNLKRNETYSCKKKKNYQKELKRGRFDFASWLFWGISVVGGCWFGAYGETEGHGDRVQREWKELGTGYALQRQAPGIPFLPARPVPHP